jgi:hypothetical protein
MHVAANWDGNAERDQLFGFGIECAIGRRGLVRAGKTSHRSRKLAAKPVHPALQFLASLG